MPPTLRRKPPAPDGPAQAVTATAPEGAARRRVRVYSDGAARGNPGPAGAGAVVLDESGTALAEIGRYLGEQTNNVAEYEGLLLGLRHALAHGATDVEVLADSQLLIRQLAGVYRVKSAGLMPLFEEAKRLLRRFKSIELRHIPREMNGAADEMSNRAIDERMND
jgi:ribonuclease HI